MATWLPFLKRGKDPLMSELEDHTFEDVVTEYDKKLKDLKFDPDLTDITWSGKTKSSTPTWSAKTKN